MTQPPCLHNTASTLVQRFLTGNTNIPTYQQKFPLFYTQANHDQIRHYSASDHNCKYKKKMLARYKPEKKTKKKNNIYIPIDKIF